MSLELLAVIAAVVGVVLAAVQVWQGQRNPSPPSDEPFSGAGQALREEAVLALTDAGYVLDEVSGIGMGLLVNPIENLPRVIDRVTALAKELVKFHARLKMAPEISDEEAETFRGVIETVLDIGRVLHSLLEKQLDSPDQEGLASGSRTYLASIRRSLNDYVMAQAEFEVAAREANGR
jgi:hypothetical protein